MRVIPQGLILGPLLFLYYINDLRDTINHVSQPTLFPDDISIICTQMSQERHIDRISNISKTACYVLRVLKPTLTIQNLKIIYFAYFHSIMSYGIMFWGNSTESYEIFKLQRRAIRTITNTSMNTPCGESFRNLRIPTFHSQYIFTLAMFVTKNIEDFTTNSDIHPRNTQNNDNLHPPLARLTKYQKIPLIPVHT
jgi:hypothetical protein